MPLILDSSSAIAIGNSFKDTKHTQHIKHHFHFVQSMIDKTFIIPLWITTKGQLAGKGTKIIGVIPYSLMSPICLSKISVQGSVQD
jgi:hypothetical protein